MNLSRRASNIPQSETRATDAKVKEMQAKGIDVISFGIGEPDFDTPKFIRDAGIGAINNGFTRYTPGNGNSELKEIIANRYRTFKNTIYSAEQVIVSSGAKHSLFNVFLAICDEGDEVIIPAPYWVSYTEMVRLCGGNPIILDTMKSGYKMTPNDLESAITVRTKAVVLNNPSNPTGAVYTAAELAAIADVVSRHGILLISDDVYEALVYDGQEHLCVSSLGDEIYKHTVVVSGVSKTYAMTGWRIGYALGPDWIIKAMGKIQGHTTSCASSISQKAAYAALKGNGEEVRSMIQQFEHRRDIMWEKLVSMPGITCPRPSGAFYCFPRVSDYFGKKIEGKKIDDSADFTAALLDKYHVAVIAGAAFGSNECVRLSYATSVENINEGLLRMSAFLSEIRD